jgi:hypothetical protein
MATTPRKPESKPTGKRVRCRFGFHRWRDFRSADDEPYRKCAFCARSSTCSQSVGSKADGPLGLNDPNMGAMGGGGGGAIATWWWRWGDRWLTHEARRARPLFAQPAQVVGCDSARLRSGTFAGDR